MKYTGNGIATGLNSIITSWGDSYVSYNSAAMESLIDQVCPANELLFSPDPGIKFCPKPGCSREVSYEFILSVHFYILHSSTE